MGMGMGLQVVRYQMLVLRSRLATDDDHRTAAEGGGGGGRSGGGAGRATVVAAAPPRHQHHQLLEDRLVGARACPVDDRVLRGGVLLGHQPPQEYLLEGLAELA